MSRRHSSRRANLLTAATLLAAAPSLFAQTATWLSPTSGTWSVPANWSTNPTYPNSTSTSALIAATGSPYTVTLNSPISLKSLTASSPDATLAISATPTSLGSLTLTGSILTLTAPLPTTLAGHVTLSDSILNLNTSLTAAQFAPFTAPRINTPINISATTSITNTGNTLPLDSTTGPLNLLTSNTTAASITGGTLGTSPDGLINLYGLASLTSVTVAGTLSIATRALASAHTSLTLNNAHISLNPGLPQFQNAQTQFTIDSLTGTGTISFDGPDDHTNDEDLFTSNIPTGVTVLTGSHSGVISVTTLAGTISAQTPNQYISVLPTIITGTLQATNQATLAVFASNAPFSNVTSTHTLTSGNWIVSNGTIAILDGTGAIVPITTIGSAASVTLSGINSSFSSTTSSTLTGVFTTNNGSLALSNQKVLNNPTTFTNTGSLTLSTSSRMSTTSMTTTGSISLDSALFSSTNSTTNSNSITLTNSASFSAGSLTNSGSITLGLSSSLSASSIPSNTGSISLTSPTSLLLLNYTGPSPIDDLRNQILTNHISTPLPNTTLAYIELSLLPPNNPRSTTARSQGADDTTLLIIPATSGDANLDGKITPDDYALLDRSFAKHLTDAHWSDGDFNYDGVVDQSDYLLIDKSYAQQSGPLSPSFLAERESQFGNAYVQSLLTSLPEPSLAACLFATFLLPRRRTHALRQF